MDLDITNRRRAFPNLALMKLSAYHKARGDQVLLNFPLCRPDITYASCVFTWNLTMAKKRGIFPENATSGGSGIEWITPELYIKTELPSEVEHIMPDYTLYPNVDFSLGFTSRGCIRQCPWCVVPQKEGHIQPWSRIYEFWDRRHRKIVLLDNNLLAASNWLGTMQDLIAEDIEVDSNQGLDIRLLSEENVPYLKKVRTKQLRFAFDHLSAEGAVREGIHLLTDYGIPARKLSFYVLVGFDHDTTALERMKILNSLGVDVFPMIYKGPDGKEPKLDFQYHGADMWHGSRRNIDKFLRLAGRLP